MTKSDQQKAHDLKVEFVRKYMSPGYQPMEVAQKAIKEGLYSGETGVIQISGLLMAFAKLHMKEIWPKGKPKRPALKKVAKPKAKKEVKKMILPEPVKKVKTIDEIDETIHETVTKVKAVSNNQRASLSENTEIIKALEVWYENGHVAKEFHEEDKKFALTMSKELENCLSEAEHYLRRAKKLEELMAIYAGYI